MKKCSRCGEEKKLEMFFRMSNAKDGRRPDCKVCSKKAKAKHAKENPVMDRCKRIGWGIISRTTTDINDKANKCYKDNNVVSKIGKSGIEIGKFLYDNFYDEIEKLIDDGETPSLDRIDSTGDYEEGNIRIVSLRENYLDGVKQAVKKTSKQVRVVKKNGDEKIYGSVSEASREIGIKRDTIINNRDKGTMSQNGLMFYNV